MKPHPECPKIEPDLTAFLTGDLPAARAAAVRDHLARCEGCRASAQELATTLDLLRGALAASPSVPERLDPARRAAIAAARPSRTTIWLDAWLVPLARAAIFVIVPALILAALMMPAMQGGRMAARLADGARMEAEVAAADPFAAPAATSERRVEAESLIDPSDTIVMGAPAGGTRSGREGAKSTDYYLMDAQAAGEGRAAGATAPATTAPSLPAGIPALGDMPVVGRLKSGSETVPTPVPMPPAAPARPAAPAPTAQPVVAAPAKAAPASGPGAVMQGEEFKLEVPKPMFVGTPVAAKVPNLEPSGTPQPRMIIGEPERNVAGAAGTDSRSTLGRKLKESGANGRDQAKDGGEVPPAPAAATIAGNRGTLGLNGGGAFGGGAGHPSDREHDDAKARTGSSFGRAGGPALPTAPMEPVVGPGRRPGRMDDSRSERSIRDTAADATIASGSARLREGDKAAGGDALDVGGGAVGQKLALDATADDAVVGLKYAGKGVSEKRDKTTALGYGYIASDKKTPSGDRWDDTDARRSNRAPVDELRRKGEAWGLDTDRDGATAPDGTVHTGAYAFALPANPEPKPQSELAKAGEDVVKRADMEKELADFAGKPEHFAVMDNGVRWPPPDLGFALQIETDKTEPQQKKEVMSEVEERLQNIVIPSIEFRQHSIADVVRHLNEQIARQDPEGKAGRIELSKDVTEPLAAAPASAADTSSDSTSGLAITLNLRKVTALDAVRYVTEVANLKRHSEDGRIIISPSAAISGAMSTRIAKCTIRPKKEGVRPSDHEIQEFLTKAGVPFPKGSRVSYDPNTSLLTVRNTPENLEIFDIVAPALHAGEEPTPVAPTFKPAGFNPVVEAAENAFSTFSIDVDTASYTMARRSILEGRRPEPESVRTEEFVNAFDYDYAPPSKGAFAIHVDGAASPFRKSMDVLRIGIKGRRIGRDQHVPSNLTLVIDTSGSMQTDDRIGLIRRSLRMLVDQLDPEDRVAVVQFGSKAALRLEPTPAAQKDEILRVIDSLETVGSTQLEGGLKLGYEVAARAFRSGASNRVILMSDGVANLGATESAGILSTVEAHRKQGVRLTVLGFGTGAYNDAMLESLADKGDGAYTFIDSEEEAKRVLVDNLAATLHVIASDVKIQVEFNPRRVQRWRQLGYENRALTKEQFRDDTVDAGEVGSGQSVTALYDVQLDGSASEWIGTVRVRYRDVETGRVEEIERRITARDFTRDFAAASPRFRLAAGVAELAELLRLSPHTFSQGRDLADALGVLRPVALELSIDPQVQELVRLAQAAQSLP